MTVPVTQPVVYDMDASQKLTAGNVTIGVSPAVADIRAPKLSELVAGTKIECAVDGYEVTADVGETSKRRLCHKVAKKVPGITEFSMADTILDAGDPQAENAFLAANPVGSTRYVWMRPGPDHTTDIAVGDVVDVTAARVKMITREAFSSDEGEEFRYRIQWAVQDHAMAVKVVA